MKFMSPSIMAWRQTRNFISNSPPDCSTCNQKLLRFEHMEREIFRVSSVKGFFELKNFPNLLRDFWSAKFWLSFCGQFCETRKMSWNFRGKLVDGFMRFQRNFQYFSGWLPPFSLSLNNQTLPTSLFDVFFAPFVLLSHCDFTNWK